MATVKEIVTEVPRMWAWLWKGTMGEYSRCFYRNFVLTLLGCAFIFPPYVLLGVALLNLFVEIGGAVFTKKPFRFIALFVSAVGIVIAYFVTWLIANYGVTFHAV